MRAALNLPRAIARMSTKAVESPPQAGGGGGGGGGVMGTVVGLCAVAGGVAYYYTEVDPTLGGVLGPGGMLGSFSSPVVPSSAPFYRPQGGAPPSVPSSTLAPPSPPPSSTSTTPAKPSSPTTTITTSSSSSSSSSSVSPSSAPLEARTERAALALALTLQSSPRATTKAAPSPALEKKQQQVQAQQSPAAATPAATAPASLSSTATTAAAAAPAVTSPPPPPPTPSPETPMESALSKARTDVRAKITTEISSVIHRDFTDKTRSSVTAMSPEEAKERLLRLMEEDYNRARLEGVRLAEFMERNESVWAGKFESFASSAMTEAEAQARAAFEKAKAEYIASAEIALARERDAMLAALQRDATTSLAQKSDELAVEAGVRATSTLGTLAALAAKVEACGELLAARNAYEKAAARAARLALATSALGEALHSRGPATHHLAALKAALRSGGGGGGEGGTAAAAAAVPTPSTTTTTTSSSASSWESSGDSVVDMALGALPPAIHSPRGVPLLSELQGSFGMVSSAGRRAPAAGTGVLGQALAGVGAAVVLPAQKGMEGVKESLGSLYQGVVGGLEGARVGVREAVAPYPPLASAWGGVEGAVAGVVDQVCGAWESGVVRRVWGEVGTSVMGALPGGGGGEAAAAAAAATPTTTTSSSSGSSSSSGGASATTSASSLPPQVEALGGELKATATATLEKGKRVFESSESAIRRAATVFDAAEDAVGREDLAGAIALLEGLKREEGQELTRSWVAAAEQRLAVDRAFALIKARSDLLVAALS